MTTTLPTFIAAFIGGSEIILIAALLGIMAFWIWMIVDCANCEKEGSTKTAWLLVILLAGFVGAPLYFFIRKLPRNIQRNQT